MLNFCKIEFSSILNKNSLSKFINLRIWTFEETKKLYLLIFMIEIVTHSDCNIKLTLSSISLYKYDIYISLPS
jgi:hypothetical protein